MTAIEYLFCLWPVRDRVPVAVVYEWALSARVDRMLRRRHVIEGART